MVHNESRICIVLARSGSKRVNKKNLQLVNNKTLVEHALICCTNNGIKTILSSDSEEILDVAQSDLVICHKRSAITSNDSASSESAIVEILNEFKIPLDTEIILIPPTHPLRTSKDLHYFLDQWELLGEPNGFNQAISVLSMQNDFWYEKNEKLNRVRDEIFENKEPRISSERNKIYLETSAVYLSSAEILYSGRSLVDGNIFPIELSRFAAFDIDEDEDLEIVQKLMEK